MHMIIMLILLAAVFFVALFMMCFFRSRLNDPLINHLFVVATAVFFFGWNYAAYELGWLKDGFMTLENISPYICTVILLTVFMRGWVKDYAYCAIAFLSVGMFIAMFLSPIAQYLMNHHHQSDFIHVTEASCHLIMALYGFYLLLSGKVKIELVNFGKAVAFMLSSIFFGVFLNWCFHRNNFGMNMYGKYSIYFLDIFGSFGATLVAYLFGVIGTLAFGFLAGEFLDRITRKVLDTDKKSLEDVSSVPTEFANISE